MCAVCGNSICSENIDYDDSVILKKCSICKKNQEDIEYFGDKVICSDCFRAFLRTQAQNDIMRRGFIKQNASYFYRGWFDCIDPALHIEIFKKAYEALESPECKKEMELDFCLDDDYFSDYVRENL